MFTTTAVSAKCHAQSAAAMSIGDTEGIGGTVRDRRHGTS
jgi:hypothetical protein